MNNTDLLIQIASQHTTLRPVSGKYLGLCPIHQEKTPSFWIYPDKGKYHCYGCNAGGDAIDLHQALTGDDYITAKRALGLWDNTRPTPRRAKPWPKQYKAPTRRRAYAAARSSLVAMRDMDIIFENVTYLNYEFIIESLKGRGGAVEYINKILTDIHTRHGATSLIYQNIFINEIKKSMEVEIV